MITKVDITLMLEVPDSTAFMDDAEWLLRKIVAQMQEQMDNIGSDFYDYHESGQTLEGKADLLPDLESAGSYKITPVETYAAEQQPEIVKIDVPVKEKERQDKITLIVAGYKVKHPFLNEYWPIAPNGSSLRTAPCRIEDEAWAECWYHYKINEGKEK